MKNFSVLHLGLLLAPFAVAVLFLVVLPRGHSTAECINPIVSSCRLAQ